MKYTDRQRKQLIESIKGKKVASLEYETEGDYWVITFDTGEEISIRLMAELQQ
jgi:hypothetical protein